MEGVPASVVQNVENLKEVIGQIEGQLSPYFAISRSGLNQKLSPLDDAKLSLLIAYALNTIFYLYLKTQGFNPATHPVKSELDRLKAYIKKFQVLTEGKQEKPTMRVDVPAAGRFISSALAPSGTTDADKDSAGEAGGREEGKAAKRGKEGKG
eukprot:CAMPEP_0177633644 /NCGR_PEP_ID=MMETSP0447-20121125/2947_1 /TAXON_ID=0 /ORGANISM="Stygamoeba regulata, Strain BSH-02190019" /LENGTH=152 /DNA_ID=CAMNT_0019135317 /DNA_START=267 /DNA_END=721 /DNA_ORIENTATION=+